MSKQPEALRLADAMDSAIKQTDADDDVIHVARWFVEDAAAELRRLHEQNQRFYAQHASVVSDYEKAVVALKAQRDALRAELKEATEAINDPAVNNLRTLAESIRMLSNQRDALLKALKAFANEIVPNNPNDPIWVKARAAIKAVEEGK